MTTRNDAYEFARRSRRNLTYIEESARRGAEVHVVTQFALSLLGLVVFPREKKLVLEAAERMTLSELGPTWGHWQVELDDPAKPTLTLLDILEHLRNAVAHAESFSRPTVETSTT